MAAGVAVGIYDSIEQAAKKIVVWEKEYIPCMINHEKYQEIEENWKKAYAVQLKLVDFGVTTSMWKAPGL